MEVEMAGRGFAKLCVSLDEIGFMHSAMNEICNGYHIPQSEFLTRLGYERRAGDKIMEKLAEAYCVLSENEKSGTASSSESAR